MVERTWDDDPGLRAEAEAERNSNLAAALEVVDARPPEYSDEALALRFTAKHHGETRFVAEWGKWLFWNEARWEFDRTIRAFDLARMVARVASAEISDAKQVKLAAKVASGKTVAAIVNLARADHRHAAVTDQWDEDPWTFNMKGTRNGNG